MIDTSLQQGAALLAQGEDCSLQLHVGFHSPFITGLLLTTLLTLADYSVAANGIGWPFSIADFQAVFTRETHLSMGMPEACLYSSSPGSGGACSQQAHRASPREVRHYPMWKEKHPIITESFRKSKDLKIHGGW